MKIWGSFYTEFKIDKDFWSSQYYLFYFLRRQIYALCQIYLNKTLYIQGGLHIFCSVFSLGYLFYYRPFKELSIFISAIISEICLFTIFLMTYFYIFYFPKEVNDAFENVIIGFVLILFSSQFLVSLFNAFKSFNKAWKKIEQLRAKSFLNNAEIMGQTTLNITLK